MPTFFFKRFFECRANYPHPWRELLFIHLGKIRPTRRALLFTLAASVVIEFAGDGIWEIAGDRGHVDGVEDGASASSDRLRVMGPRFCPSDPAEGHRAGAKGTRAVGVGTQGR